MTKNTAHEALERRVFEDFQNHCKADLPEGDVVYLDRPDVRVLRTEGGILGIEIAEYHRDLGPDDPGGSARRKNEERVARLVDEAKKKYEAVPDRRKLTVYLIWPTDRLLPNGCETKLAGQLANLVGRVAPTSGCTHVFREDIQEPLSRFLAGAVIAGCASDTSFWQASEADFLNLSPSAIQNILDLKEQKLADYRLACDDCWLLIPSTPRPCIGIADAGRFSTCGQMTETTKKHAFASSFQRAYFQDVENDSWVRLILRSPS